MACALVGLTLAAIWLVVVPPRSVGTVTLLLAHDPSTQPDTAMATDVSLLRTRAVAQELSDRLALDEAPEDLQRTIVTQPTTSSVLQLDIAGSGPDDAVQRARVLAETYLAFREEQLLSQAGAVIQGYHQRIEALQAQVDDISRQYDLITAEGQDTEQAADLLTRRAQLLAQISTLEDSVGGASLEVSAVVAASRVLDPASLVPQSSVRRAALALGSGLIGGLGIGLGLVVVYAVTTGRLRRRSDVAAAIGLPVRFSAGRVVPKWGRWGPRNAASLDLLVDGLETALSTGRRRPIRLGLLCVDCDRAGARVMAGLVHRLSAEKSVAALDLGESGLLAEEMARLGSDPEAEEGQPAMVLSGPHTDVVADVVLTFVTFEIGRGLGHVKASAPTIVILVAAGRSTPEGLRTVAQATRAAGIDVAFVMLVGTDSSDDSFGGAAEVVATSGKAPGSR